MSLITKYCMSLGTSEIEGKGIAILSNPRQGSRKEKLKMHIILIAHRCCTDTAIPLQRANKNYHMALTDDNFNLISEGFVLNF